MIKDDVISKIVMNCSGRFKAEDIKFIQDMLYITLSNYDVVPLKNEIEVYKNNDMELIQRFLIQKKIDGLSDRTLKVYGHTLRKNLHLYIEKPICYMTKDDMRTHFAKRMIDNPSISKSYLDTERRYFNTFFTWLAKNELIKHNPMNAINRIKQDKIIKQPFTEKEVETMRIKLMEHLHSSSTQKEKSKWIRDIAIFEFLLSTGCRVSELTSLKTENLNLNTKECKVFGKGSKERICFLNTKSLMALKEYLKDKNEDTEYVFVSNQIKHGKRNKLEKSAIEIIVRELGRECGVNAHPHKFRRTCATTLLQKGMPIEQVQIILGHEEIETTLIYAKTNMKNVKLNHEKFM